MRVLHVSAELRPLARVGDLAEAVSALAAASGELGHDVRCALPRWRGTERRLPAGTEETRRIDARVLHAGRFTPASVARVEGPRLPAPVLLVDHEAFHTDDVYGEGVEATAARWSVLGRALLDALSRDPWAPEIVHAHDAQAAPFAALARWRWPVGAPRPAVVYTVHDLSYPATVSRDWLQEAALPQDLDYPMGPLEFHGKVNLHKLGIEAADRITTVSARYAEELLTDPGAAAGLEGVLGRRASALEGIPHGLDPEAWGPEHDPALRWRYTAEQAARKARTKAELREELALDVAEPDVPLLLLMGRLDPAGGLDLLLPALDALLEDRMQIALLGTGEPRVQAGLRAASMRRPGRLALRFSTDERLTRRLLAGADLVLVPARRDAGGMRAMLGLRYGAVPVAHATGGLADVVRDVDEDPAHGNGFLFRHYQPIEFLKSVRRAVRARRDTAFWSTLVARGMAERRPWGAVAERYAAAYARAREAAR